jgi:hypothetical protein
MRHELHLARIGFMALGAVAAVAAVVGFLVGAREGAVSALVGAGLVAGNHLVAVASTGWARVLGPRVIAIGYSVFVIRMMLVLGIFGSLSTIDWIQGTVLAVTFCVALVVTLAAECFSYARGSYVPAWMRGQALLGGAGVAPAGLVKETR